MKTLRMTSYLGAPLAVVLAFAGLTVSAAAETFYQQKNLVSDGFVPADHTDANVINAWGIAFNPFGPVWVADNGAGVSTLYDGAGNPLSLVVQIPGPAGSSATGNPTGIVFNGSSGFPVSNGTASGASRFIFATEDGVIAGWAPAVDATHARRAADNSTQGAVYKGLALSAGGKGSLLYAADFHNNKVDVFDSTFNPVMLMPGAFIDPHLPAGFAPFGLQALNGNIYVSYAKQDAQQHDDVQGPGLGFVSVFDPNGVFIRRVVSRGRLNAPWGMAMAPAGFGRFSNCLLIGNFGDGKINAYNLANGAFVGQLTNSHHRSVQIDGLWGIAFGNGFAGQPVNTLFFAAGVDDEQHGLYGRIDAVTEHEDAADEAAEHGD